jgi:hypothetical protein
MAEQNNIGFSVSVNSNDATKSLKELRSEIDKTTQSVEKLGEQYGENSKEVEAAQRRLQQLQETTNQKQEESNQRIDNAAKTVSALSAAYGGVQGALELTGLAGEDTIKQLAKIQSALAIGDAVQNIAEFRGAIVSTFTSLKDGAVKAFQAIKAGIGATGIGLLVIALGSIVAYWDEIKAAVSGVSEEQKKLLEDTQADAKAQQEKLSTIDSQDNILKLQGKSEKEILALKIKQTGEVISATEKQVAQQKIVLQAQLSAEKRNKEILQGILNFVTAPLQLVIDGVNQVAKVFGKGFDFNVAEKLSGLVFDPKETEKKGQEEIAALDKTLTDLKNKRAGYQLSVQAIDKQASDAAKANSDKLLEEQNARFQKQLDDEKKLTDDLLAEYDKRRKFAVTSKTITQDELRALDEEDRKKQEEINNKRIEGQLAVISRTKNYTLELIKNNQDLNEKLKADNDAAREAELAAKFAFASAVAQGIGELTGLFEQGTAASKVAGLAQIAISTGVGFAQGLDIAQKSAKATGPAAAFAFPIFYATQVAAVLAAASKAKSILAQVKGGGAAGGVTAPTIQQQAPIAPAAPEAATTNISAQSINALGNQATRAYVIESDVTSSQQRIAAIQQRARFG